MVWRRLCTVTGLILACGQTALLARPVERDVWHEITYQGQRYGYKHTTVTKLADGNFHYSVEARALVNLLGQKSEVVERAQFVVTPSYRPVSIACETERMSGGSSANGEARGDTLAITIASAGLERKRLIDLSEQPILPACLGEWLAGQPVETDRVTMKVLDDTRWVIRQASAVRELKDASGSRWCVDLGVELGQGAVSYTPDGVMRELDFDVPKMQMRRCTAKQAKDIKHYKFSGASVLQFPINKDISSPDLLTSLKARLTWKEIPFDRFALEDIRQKVVDKTEKNGQYLALVELAPVDLGANKTPYPIRGAEFEPYLAETEYIKPRDARIERTARRAVAGTATALEAVKAMSAWVNENVESALIPETLTGPEVLECRKGKCAEYAILFASMARSIGIPTRLVLGERMTPGHWIGHMWNEAYVGMWVPVDATVNEVGHSLALLKLTHSDTVMGTQRLRWALTDSLDVVIEDVKMKAVPGRTEYTSGIAGHVYTNVDYGCRITAPAEDWTIEDKSTPGVATVRFGVPGQPAAKVHVVAFGLPPTTAPKAVLDGRVAMFRASYTDFKILNDEPRNVKGIQGHLLRFGRTSTDGSATILTTEVVWKSGAHGYLANLIAEQSLHDRVVDDFFELLNGFEHIGVNVPSH